MEILELKNITEIKNSVYGLSSVSDTAGKWARRQVRKSKQIEHREKMIENTEKEHGGTWWKSQTCKWLRSQNKRREKMR